MKLRNLSTIQLLVSLLSRKDPKLKSAWLSQQLSFQTVGIQGNQSTRKIRSSHLLQLARVTWPTLIRVCLASLQLLETEPSVLLQAHLISTMNTATSQSSRIPARCHLSLSQRSNHPLLIAMVLVQSKRINRLFRCHSAPISQTLLAIVRELKWDTTKLQQSRVCLNKVNNLIK